jgi:hypothetical protein
MRTTPRPRRATHGYLTPTSIARPVPDRKRAPNVPRIGGLRTMPVMRMAALTARLSLNWRGKLFLAVLKDRVGVHCCPLSDEGGDLVAARQAVCEGGNQSRGSMIPPSCAELRSRVAQDRCKTSRADLACTPRSHLRQVIRHPPITTTTHQPILTDNPTPLTRPTSKHAPQRPHTESHHHHDRNP